MCCLPVFRLPCVAGDVKHNVSGGVDKAAQKVDSASKDVSSSAKAATRDVKDSVGDAARWVPNINP